MNIDDLKKEAKKRKCNVNKLLALTSNNDPFYMPIRQIEQAEWIAKIWKKEGSPKIHPRGFHYRIVDKNYKMPNGIVYLNDDKCWTYLQSGFKYARLIGLIPYDQILDMKNNEGIESGDFTQHAGITYDTLYRDSVIVEYADDYENDDEYIEAVVENIHRCFEVDFNNDLLQPFYIEIWAEKSGIIPEQIAKNFNATIREAGGGEFSVDMPV